jgi:hypothetical protein
MFSTSILNCFKNKTLINEKQNDLKRQKSELSLRKFEKALLRKGSFPKNQFENAKLPPSPFSI